ncbi:MAG: hypothetical protein ABWW70_02560 [Thermoproteota archaeon]
MRDATQVMVLGGDAGSRAVSADVVISPLAGEPLISDVLAGALGLAVEDSAEWPWRFGWEPRERVGRIERRTLR